MQPRDPHWRLRPRAEECEPHHGGGAQIVEGERGHHQLHPEDERQPRLHWAGQRQHALLGRCEVGLQEDSARAQESHHRHPGGLGRSDAGECGRSGDKLLEHRQPKKSLSLQIRFWYFHHKQTSRKYSSDRASKASSSSATPPFAR